MAYHACVYMCARVRAQECVHMIVSKSKVCI